MSAAAMPFNRSEGSAEAIRQREQSRWLSGKLDTVRGLRPALKSRHEWVSGRASVARANSGLLRQVDALRNRGLLFWQGVTFDFGLSLDADDHEIREFSEAKARQCERVLDDSRDSALVIAEVLERCRIDSGLIINGKTGEIKPDGWQARVCCDRWWRRKMRVVCARGAEAVARDNGMTSKRAGAYVSNFTFRRWLSQQNRNKLLLEEMVATNDEGQEFTLAELAELGQSNPVLRRGELMVRMRGFEEWAERDAVEWVPMFYTVTCPSKYHAQLSKGGKNGKYNRATPRAAQEYLCSVWARFRSAAAKQGLTYYGFRVAEPHHDGTPHWHLLLFVCASQREGITSLLEQYALAEDGTEPGARKYRFEAVEITPERGTAAGYIAKYVAKNIDGFAVGDDWEAEGAATDTALRVRAWASVWGIRQFQQIGGAPVTVWRELRRAANNPERVHETEQLKLVLEPADAGDWSKFTGAMGGAVCRREDRPARVIYSEKNEKTGEVRRGRYGEVVRRVLGVMGVDFLVVTRFREWVTEFKNRVSVLVVGGYRDLYQAARPLAEGFKMSPRFKFADGVYQCDLQGAPPARPLDLCQ